MVFFIVMTITNTENAKIVVLFILCYLPVCLNTCIILAYFYFVQLFLSGFMFINLLLLNYFKIFAKLYFCKGSCMKKFLILFLFSGFIQLALAQSTPSTHVDIFSHSKTPLLTWQQIIESRWKTIDKDKNNMLDKSEIQHISSVFLLLSFKYFKELDNNRDGFVSHEELKTYSQEQENKQKEKINRHWNQLDTNSDYKITVDEVNNNQDIKDNFSNIDTNSDNMITPEEFIVFYNKTVSSKLGI